MSHRRGFSLIEMSIVLVIIGLLIGGILAGQHMLRQAQLTSIAVDAQRYAQAVLQFEQKYGTLPGDFADATNYWGAAAGIAGDNYTASCYSHTANASNPATCNGDGDGRIMGNSAIEGPLVWQHLADAQLIQGQYTGVGTADGPIAYEPGINTPTSRVEGTGWCMYSWGIFSGNPNFFDGDYGTSILLGNHKIGGCPTRAALTAQEAAILDAKYDDGLPARGTIRTWKAVTGYTPNCATTADASTATYNVATSGPQCSLLLLMGL